MKKISSGLILMLVLIFAFILNNAQALDEAPKQVMIESKIMYVHEDFSRELGVDFAFAQTMEGDKKILEVSTLPRGKGIDARSWLVDSTMLNVDSIKLKPILSEKTYVSKAAMGKSIAVPLFATLGSQYQRYAKKCEDSPGTNCSVADSTQTSTDRSTFSKSIDRAGMAAGLGLITSQSKGDYEGLKSRFDISDIPLVGALFKVKIKHRDRQKLITIVTPVIIEDFDE